MRSIKEQNLEILDCVEETLEKTQQKTTKKDVEVEEDDNDLDETLGERLLGLTEMFSQFMHTGAGPCSRKPVVCHRPRAD